MWAMIATWRMAKEGLEKASELLKQEGSVLDALECAVKEVEDFPYYKSVGYGGLPNEQMEVELDAGFMDGDTLGFGAVCAIRDIANPVSVARKLSQENVNCVLVGQGATEYAKENGFEVKEMLTDRAKVFYHKRKKEMEAELKAYRGHDTVGVLAVDTKGSMGAATSTSGLFMKKRGRVGDSPLIGSGLYADSEAGAASATGLGEDLMKGCISYEIVTLMKQGMHPQKACEKAVFELEEKLKRRHGSCSDLSVVAMNPKGEWGCATNIENYSVAVARENEPVRVYLVHRVKDHCELEEASPQWMDEYMAERMKPVEENHES